MSQTGIGCGNGYRKLLSSLRLWMSAGIKAGGKRCSVSVRTVVLCACCLTVGSVRTLKIQSHIQKDLRVVLRQLTLVSLTLPEQWERSKEA